MVRKRDTLSNLLLAVLVLTASGYLVTGGQSVPTPNVEIQDYGDWGTVTDDRVEVVTTFWTNNPYPIGLTMGEFLHIHYSLTLNGVSIAEGSRSRIDFPEGNTSQTQTTYIQTDRLVSWWVRFLSDNETLDATVNGQVRITTPIVNWTYRTTKSDTQFEDRTPILDSISRVVERTEGRYVTSRRIPISHRQVVVGAEVKDAWATWGRIDAKRTTLLIHYRIHNPSDTVPLAVDSTGLRMSLAMNDIELFHTGNGTLSPNTVNTTSLIRPGETRTVTFVVTMNNDRVGDWFRSHVQRGEQSDIDVRAYLVLDPHGTGETVRIPNDNATYHCRIQTAILEDNQPMATTCGDSGKLP
ncbi:LEA type 2 family protein [Haladaptatus sp. DYF46]|uniref:LEA type 2 family protein n=1 Tax=Haladaptatus sp. DYF46 TaxID=2886041 RepID=UPI001E34FDD5|nr:LEA type 2 family protein [Haladaptatus sp. DYF46]